MQKLHLCFLSISLLVHALGGASKANAYAWDNGFPMNTNVAPSITGFVAADDFVVDEPTTLVHAVFWAAKFDPSPSNVFSWTVFEHANDRPGAMVATYTETSPVVFGGHAFYDGRILITGYRLSMESLALQPGRYWISFHDGPWGSPDDGSDLLWGFTHLNHGFPHRRDTNGVNPTWPFSGYPLEGDSIDLAFRLSSVIVPEPQSMSMCFAAASLLSGRFYGRSKKWR
jgi:hypothetical protein